MTRFAAATGAAILLAACQGEPATDEPITDEPSAEASATPTEGVSIIRPDIEEAVMIPLEPLELTLDFAESGTELTDDAIAELEALVETRQVTEGGPIVIGGHSDAGGNDAVNRRVSLQRAEAVRDFLLENGVAEDRMTVIAFGEQNPVEPNALPDGEPDEAGRRANRRVEIRVEVPEGMMVEATPRPSGSTSTPAAEAAD